MSLIKSWGITGFIVAILFAFSVSLFFSTDARKKIRHAFSRPERVILSVATGKILPNSADGKVVKLMTPDGIALEIYGPIKDNIQPLIDRILLRDKYDGYFQFKGRAANLALKDMNNDDIFEVIAPSYDSSLTPHLNIFKYDGDSSSFQPYIE
ncbi:MAG: hypothetical protein A2Z20_01950 [Bdellovibrionales bacterium RBG_16_40_8]|nr:MAG: hypothetical protein A2Z20_01950 [Bdellovibrionales bacterium RBG_16_40_8]